MKISRLYMFEGLKRVEAAEARIGDIIAVSGVGDITIGETICDIDCPEPLPFVEIDEPTITMTFSVNKQPLCRKGRYFRYIQTLKGQAF
jgi:GTP-binding protein